MSRHHSLAIALATLLSASPLSSIANEPHARGPLDAAVAAAIRPTMAQYRIPGMAVAIHAHGQRYYFNYGVASKADNQPVTAETLFEIGSVSKLYGATLAGYAIASGKLSLDTPVSRNIPALAGSAFDHISVLQVGGYTSGGLPMQFPTAVTDDASALRWLHDWKPTLPSGRYRVYSNPSIALLGFAAAGSLGEPCTQAIEHTLISGLKLRQTWANVPESQRPNYAQGYREDDTATRSDSTLMCVGAWGGLRASTTGLMDFLEANLDPSNLPPTWQRAIELTQTGRYRTPRYLQGLGWEIYPWPVTQARMVESGNSPTMSGQENPVSLVERPEIANHDSLLNKTGSTSGFSSYVVALPGRDIAIVMLANKANWPRKERVKAALAILRALDATAPTP